MTRSETPKGRRAVIFDRDGVLNLDHGYVADPKQLDWIAGARAAVKRLNEAGVLVIVATNQSGVARGYFDEAAVDAFHAAMQSDLARDGAHIDAFYVAPHHPEAVTEAFRHSDHPDRKPNPGMVLRALADWDVDPERAVLIGDKSTDMAAARAAGVRGALFDGGDLDAFVRGLGIV
ncbi:MAG: D-glycero-alpha-D-manno-heptose-1,7-bisphosphate 7-phosphatase [Caulobacterales bacterium]